MKPSLLPEPERWSERGSGTSAEDAVGAAFKRIRDATEPSNVAAARWARSAMAPVRRASAAPRLWAAAIVWHAHVSNARARALPGEGPAPGRPPRTPRAHGVPGAAAATESGPTSAAEPVPADEPMPPPPSTLARPSAAPLGPSAAPLRLALETPRRAPPAAPEEARPTTEPPPTAPANGPDETELLARAFRLLRSEGDAAGALAALDEHDRRFGAGPLASEATLARAEALLLLGRTGEALPLLMRLRDARAGLTPNVRATRAELLARANRCDDAAGDFAALLAPGAPAATRERALYARASCALQGARPAAAIPDLATWRSSPRAVRRPPSAPRWSGCVGRNVLVARGMRQT